jgi:GNAT superfamily N-acetyltransferase
MVTIRDARAADLPALTAIKGEGSEVLHRDRLHDAQNPTFRYLVLLEDGEMIGFGCLVIQRPAYWSDGADTERLPCIIDLQIKESRRGQGFGFEFIHQIEATAGRSGFKQLFIAVEPLDNPRAFALYRRLGYQQLQPEPYLKAWEFTDSAGRLHHGEDWLVDMVKPL